MFKICCLILKFLGYFFLLKGRKSIFLSASRSRFVAIGPAKSLKIGQWITLLWPKRLLNRDFALAGEIIHKDKFSFYATFLTRTRRFDLMVIF